MVTTASVQGNVQGQVRSKSIQIRLNPQEHSLITNAAEFSGGTLSDYCRRAVMAHVLKEVGNPSSPFDEIVGRLFALCDEIELLATVLGRETSKAEWSEEMLKSKIQVFSAILSRF